MFQTPALTQSIRRRRIAAQRTHTPASFAAARRLRFSAAGSGPTTPAANDRRTSWGEPTIPSMTAVFKSTPKFDPPPVGGNTEAAAHRKTKVDLFLRSNRFVRDMLDGRRPHIPTKKQHVDLTKTLTHTNLERIRDKFLRRPTKDCDRCL